jgi:hypothetical protein
MIQEKKVDFKASLLQNINQLNNNKNKNIITSHETLNNETYKKPIPLNISIPPLKNQPVLRFTLNPDELLNKKKTLNKISVKETKEIKEDEDEKNIPEYMEQKNKLKKVETDEKCLLNILKKEHEDKVLSDEKPIDKEEKENNDLEKELEELLKTELEEKKKKKVIVTKKKVSDKQENNNNDINKQI